MCDPRVMNGKSGLNIRQPLTRSLEESLRIGEMRRMWQRTGAEMRILWKILLRRTPRNTSGVGTQTLKPRGRCFTYVEEAQKLDRRLTHAPYDLAVKIPFVEKIFPPKIRT